MSEEQKKRVEEIAQEAVVLGDLLYEEVGKLTDRPLVAWSAACRLVNMLHHDFLPLDADKSTTLSRIRLICDAIGADLATAPPTTTNNEPALRHRGPRVFRRRV